MALLSLKMESRHRANFLSWLVATKVVIMPIASATSDDQVGNMTNPSHTFRTSDAYMRRNLTIISSDTVLSPGRCRTIIWPNARILLIGPLAA